MKTVKVGKRISLNKERIVSLNNEQLCQIKGGGRVTWVDCPIGPLEPPKTTDPRLTIQR